MLIEGRQAIGPTVAVLEEFGISVHAAGLSEASSEARGLLRRSFGDRLVWVRQ